MTAVLILGSDAREHAIAWKLRQSSAVEQLYVAPGNPGTAAIATNLALSVFDPVAVTAMVEELGIDLTVIGPEAILATGVADVLRERGHAVVGPSAHCFQLEGSKSFAKGVMEATGVPTARAGVFSNVDSALAYARTFDGAVVIKADGLAAGKGVSVCRDMEEAEAALRSMLETRRFGDAGDTVLVEERLEGKEVSLICLVDGEKAVPLPVAQDHKRLLAGDLGPNTGGMGAYAPVPFLSDDDVASLVEQTVTPVIRRMAADGHPYRGILFAGLMLTDNGPRVLEFNCRFGDPETQALMPLIDEDLYGLLRAVAIGRLPPRIAVSGKHAAAVVAATAGYPDHPETGAVISGIDADGENLIFHAGTALNHEGELVTAGGRALSIVGVADTLSDALASAYRSPVSFEGMQVRRDIGWQALATPESPPPLSSPSAEFRVLVLASGGGSNLQALIDAQAAGMLQASICGVVSHEVNAFALERARQAHIAFAYVPITSRRNAAHRATHEAALLETIRAHQPELVVLAGWMLVLSGGFIDSLGVPIINVHPALLPMTGQPLDIPILRGAHAVRDALELRLPYTGASVHHVTSKVDAGPVICREAVTILPGDDETSLHSRLKLVEHRLLIDAINQLGAARYTPTTPFDDQPRPLAVALSTAQNPGKEV